MQVATGTVLIEDQIRKCAGADLLAARFIATGRVGRPPGAFESDVGIGGHSALRTYSSTGGSQYVLVRTVMVRYMRTYYPDTVSKVL